MHNTELGDLFSQAMLLAQCIKYTAATMQLCYVLHVRIQSPQLSQPLQP